MTSLSRFLPCFALLLPLTTACFENQVVGEDDGGTADAGSKHDSGTGTARDTGTTLPSCGSGEACPTGSTCFFPIGSCSAKGQCQVWPAPGTAECEAIEQLCGCDGTPVTTGCDAPQGYATGPTTGASGSNCGAKDAGKATAACSATEACPSGSTCFYPIGSCAAKGECQVWPAPGTAECGAIEALCGCDGTQVTTGCDAPQGYATGPTTGEQTEDCAATDAGTPTGCEGTNPGCCGFNTDGCEAIVAQATCSSGGWTCPAGDSLGPVCNTLCKAVDAGNP